MEGFGFSRKSADEIRLSYYNKIKSIAKRSQSIAACAHMIPDDEPDRNGLLEQFIENQEEIIKIIELFIKDLGGD